MGIMACSLSLGQPGSSRERREEGACKVAESGNGGSVTLGVKTRGAANLRELGSHELKGRAPNLEDSR